MEKTEIMRRSIHQEAVRALVNSRLPHDHAIGAVLESEAQIIGEPGAGSVRIVDANGNWVMLEQRIKELKCDPRFRDTVPHPTRVARGDESGLRDNFEQIAKGTAIVE
ncbi:MAG TPA: hypothetical protein VMX38_24305 [Verrucomicrobiae bacterium]|nr:hypothetical protein [Verrucomicrobiae bacterium]